MANYNITLKLVTKNIIVRGGAAGVTSAINLGAGAGIYASLTGSVLNFKSLVAGAGLSIATGANELTLSAQGGHIIQEEGAPLTSRAGLNFISANLLVEDDVINDRTNVTLTDTPTFASLTITGGVEAVGWVSSETGLYGTGVQTNYLRLGMSVFHTEAGYDITAQGSHITGYDPMVSAQFQWPTLIEDGFLKITAAGIISCEMPNLSAFFDITVDSIVFNSGVEKSICYIGAAGDVIVDDVNLKWDSVLNKLTVIGDIEAASVSASTVLVAKGALGNAGIVRLNEDPDNGANYVDVKAPSLLAANYSIVLPDAAPANLQIPKWNSALGRLEWEDIASQNLDFFGFDVQAIIRNPMLGYYYFDDFESQLITDLGTASAGGGTRTKGTYGQDATKKAFGVQTLSVATATTARVTSILNVQAGVPIGLGKLLWITRLAFTTLSTSSEEFHYEHGIFNGYSVPAGMQGGIGFGYQRSIDGDFWVVNTNGGVSTKTVTSIPVTTNYIWWAFTVNAAWNSVSFYSSSDGVTWTLAATHTTNIPTSGNYNFSIAGQMGKEVGATARLGHCDLGMIVYFYNR